MEPRSGIIEGMEPITKAQEYFGVSEERLLICLINWAKSYHYVDPYLIEYALDRFETDGKLPEKIYPMLEIFIEKYGIEIN